MIIDARISYIITIDDQHSLFFPVGLHRVPAHGTIFCPAHGNIIGIDHDFQPKRFIEHVHITAAVSADDQWARFDERLYGVCLPVILWDGRDDLTGGPAIFHHAFNPQDIHVGDTQLFRHKLLVEELG